MIPTSKWYKFIILRTSLLWILSFLFLFTLKVNKCTKLQNALNVLYSNVNQCLMNQITRFRNITYQTTDNKARKNRGKHKTYKRITEHSADIKMKKLFL